MVEGALSIDTGTSGSFADRVYSTYPLRFIPCTEVRRGKKRSVDDEEKADAKIGTVAMFFMIGFGGGYVSGDCVNVSLDVKEDASCCLRTQGTTKVFESVRGAICRQTITSTLDSGSLLVYVPDPTSCFASSVFEQVQKYMLVAGASCVIVDMYSSGRKNQNENWSAKRIRNRIEVYIDDDLKFLENMKLESHDNLALPSSNRVKSSIFGTIVIAGPRTKVLDDTLNALSQRQSFHEYQLKRKHTRTTNTSSNANKKDLISESALASVSTLSGGINLVRFCAQGAEDAFSFLHDTLSPLNQEIGFRPYSDRIHFVPPPPDEESR